MNSIIAILGIFSIIILNNWLNTFEYTKKEKLYYNGILISFLIFLLISFKLINF